MAVPMVQAINSAAELRLVTTGGCRIGSLEANAWVFASAIISIPNLPLWYMALIPRDKIAIAGLLSILLGRKLTRDTPSRVEPYLMLCN